MSEPFEIGDQLPILVDQIVESYFARSSTHHIDKKFLPSQEHIISATKMLLELMYPGYLGRQHLTHQNIAFHVGELLPRIGEILHRETYHSLCSGQEIEGRAEIGGDECWQRAEHSVIEFLSSIPELRRLSAGDVQAAFDGDPAATDTAEVILCYPGVLAVTVYRLAHRLFELSIPRVPRIMSEWAHSKTGIDIHPGATVGESFFIDHGTGVVIGETAHIGDHVKIYQGVTLGALSFPRDVGGRIIREHKRHPTVKDGATLYANAIVLGGETTIGSESVVGGSVFLTSSIPARCTVTIKTPELTIREDSAGGQATSAMPAINPDPQL